jgi:hypothetical protein
MLQGQAEFFNHNVLTVLGDDAAEHCLDLLEQLDSKTERPYLVKLATQLLVRTVQSPALDTKYPYVTIAKLFEVFDLFANTAENRPHVYPLAEQSLRLAYELFMQTGPDLSWLTTYSQAITNTIKAGYTEELADLLMKTDATSAFSTDRALPALENLVIASISLSDDHSQTTYDLVNTFRTLTAQGKLFPEDAFAIKHIIEQASQDTAKLHEIAEVTNHIEDIVHSISASLKASDNISNMKTRFRNGLISMTSYTDSDAFAHSAAPDVIKRAIRRTTQPGLLRNVLLSALQDISFIKKFASRHQTLSSLFEEIKYQATLEHARTGGRPSTDVSMYINSQSRADEPPSRDADERNSMFFQGVHLRWRLAKFILGHGGWQFNAKSLPVNQYYAETPLILRAARELGATTTLRANASSHQISPGPGVQFKGIDPHKFLLKSELEAPTLLQSPFIASVLKEYEEALPHLSTTTFTFLRGALIVQNPSIRFQAKQGKKSYNIPLALVIFNEHFRNSPNDSALLIPDKFIKRLLKEEAFIEADDYAGFHYNRPDICALKGKLTHDFLMEKSDQFAEAGGIPIINLMALSTIGGSLAKAMPPESAPFMIWQRELDVIPDDGGHPHYYYAFKEGVNDDTQGFELRDLKVLHEAIYQVGTQAVKLLELFELGYALYCQGLDGDQIKQDQSSDDTETAPDIADSYEAWSDPKNRRMLHEALYWHHQHHPYTRDDRSHTAYPVLCMTPMLQPGIPADNTFYLDTLTMLLTTADGTVYDMRCEDQDLPEHILQVWQQEVVGKYFGQNMTPRFLHRVHLESPTSN